MIELVDSGIVYRHPKPYLQSIQARHPSLIRFEDGELLVAFDLGQADESLDYRTYRARSLDGGTSWQLEGALFANPPGRPTSYSVRISAAGGEVLAFGSLHYRDDPEEGLVNRATLGFVPTDLILLRSLDRGHTWSPPQVLRPAIESPAWETCHHVVSLPGGRWLAPTATWRGWDGRLPAGEQTVVLISDDRGASWPTLGRVFDGRESGLIHWEVSVAPLRDGRIVAVAWVHDPRTMEDHPNAFALSEDDGATWSPPRSTGLHGQTCKELQLTDGRLLSVYRRLDEPGLWAILATLGPGDDWTNVCDLAIWQGVAASGSTTNSADALAALRFGYPSPVLLPDGDVLVAFWCVEDCQSIIRLARLRVA
jgi:sialidase-1